MEDTETDDTANELKVIEMLWVHARVGVDLEGIVVVSGVLKQTVEGVEHFVRKKEEEFSERGFSNVQVNEDATHLERPP